MSKLRTLLCIAFLAIALGAGTAQAQTVSAADSCGEVFARNFIGRPVDALRRVRPAVPSLTRYVCNSCLTTLEFIGSRLTVRFDPSTERITSVRCG